jgi:hypothetical protein
VFTDELPELISEGTPPFRGQNQTLINELVRSTAYLDHMVQSPHD